MSTLPPRIDLTRQKPSTRILIETDHSVWSFKLVDPANGQVEVTSTDERFKHSPTPIMGQLVESAEPLPGVRKASRAFVKGWPFQLRFKNVDLISFAVKSGKVEGDGWSYEAI